MSKKKKFFKFIRRMLLVLFVLVSAVDIGFETIGIPAALRDRAVAAVHEALEVDVTVERIKAGIFNGIVFEGCTLTTTDADGNEETVTMDRVDVGLQRRFLFLGKVRVGRIQIDGGSMRREADSVFGPAKRELAKVPAAALEFTDISGSLTLASDEFTVEELTVDFLGITIIVSGRVSLAGLAKLPEKKAMPAATSALLHRHWRQLSRSLTEDPPDEGSAIGIRFDLPPEGLPGASASISGEALGLHYRGVRISLVVAEMEVTATALDVKELRVNLSDLESVKCSGRIDLDTQKVQGHLDASVFPGPLLDLFYPAGKPYLEDIRFGETPPQLQVELMPSPLEFPKLWWFKIRSEISDTMIRDANVTSIRVDAELGPHGVRVETLNIHCRDGAVIEAGLVWDRQRRALTMTGTIDGDPLVLSDLAPESNFKITQRKIWEAFEWNGETPPHLDVTVAYFPDRGKFGWQVNGAIRGGPLKYHGVAIDSVQSDVLVDVETSLLLLENLKITSGDAAATAELAWTFARDDRRIRVRLDSGIDVETLLGLFHHEWPKLLGRYDLALSVRPRIRVHGEIGLNPGSPSDLEAQLDAATLRVKTGHVQAVHAKGHWDGVAVDGVAHGESLTVGDWTMSDVIMDKVVFKAGKMTASGRLAGVKSVFGDTVSSTSFKLETANGALKINSKSQIVSAGPWVLDDVTAETRVVGGKWVSTGHVAKATGERTVATHVSFEAGNKGRWGNWNATGTIEDGAVGDRLFFADVAFDIVAHDGFSMVQSRLGSVSEAGRYRAENVLVDGVFAAGTGLFDGTADALVLVESDVTIHDLKIANGVYEDGDIDIAFHAGRVEAPSALMLRGVSGTWKARPGNQSGIVEAEALEQGKGVNASGLKVEFTRREKVLNFRAGWRRIEIGQLTLHDAATNGWQTESSIRLKLTAKTAAYGFVPITDVEARVLQKGKKLSISGITGGILNGTLKGDASFNFDSGKSNYALAVAGVSLNGLIESGNARMAEDKADSKKEGDELPPPKKKKKKRALMPGKVAVDLNFLYDGKAEKGIRLSGNGSLKITEGDFLKLPLLSGFFKYIGKFVPGADLARITTIEGGLLVKGGRIYFPNLRSDGSVVALSARGFYVMNGGRLEFRVQARPLPTIFGFIPGVSNVTWPIRFLLERRLTGTLKAPRWEEVSGIRDLIRDEDKELKPPK